MFSYDLIVGGLLIISGIGIGAWIFYKGIQVGVNMATRPESIRMFGEANKIAMDDSTN